MLNKDSSRMHGVAEAVSNSLPDGFGFIVLAFPTEGIQDDPRVAYASNCKREDCIKVLKNFLFMAGEAEDWMKHI